MLDRRGLIAIVATILADTAWLYPVLALFSVIFVQGVWPLPLALILAVIALGVIVGRAVPGIVEEPSNRASFQALLGLAAVYLAISAVADQGAVDVLWGPHLIGGGFSGNVGLGLVAATAAVGFLWRRGIRIAVETHPRLRLLHTFRTGIVALAAVILVEQALDRDFSATAMLVPFFAISLAGLAFARLPPGGAWSGVAGLAVMAVIGGGLVIGLIGAAVGGHGLGLLSAGWSHLLSAIVWLLTVLLAPLLSGLGFLQDLDLMFPPLFGDWLVQLMKYPLLLLAIYLLYRLFRWSYRTHALRVRVLKVIFAFLARLINDIAWPDRAQPDAPAAKAVDRESIRGEADAKADMIKLAMVLLPGWLKPAAPPVALRFPRDRPGISEAYILYFEMLTAARDGGYDFAPSATPRERRSDVENAVPGAPVKRITDCFNAACYGNIATDRNTLERLRRELEGAVRAG
jgi:hypothetical protein